MKKLILPLLAAIFSFSFISAQEIPDRKPDDSKPIIKEKIVDKKEKSNLNLTDDQKTKLKSLNQDMRKQMEDLRKQDNISKTEYREKMEALHKDRQAQFESVLTQDQRSQLQKDKEARSARGKEFGKKKQAKMKEQLNLTDEQVAKMTDNRKVSAEKMKAIRENGSLTDEQKKQQFKEVMKKQKEDTKSILTDEQLQKMKEYHKQHHTRNKKEV